MAAQIDGLSIKQQTTEILPPGMELAPSSRVQFVQGHQQKPAIVPGRSGAETVS